MSGAIDHLRADVDYALSELGVDYIDIIVLCRVPKDVTIEEAVQNMKILVDEGKARHIALSEASASNIRRAHAVAPIYCIEQGLFISLGPFARHLTPPDAPIPFSRVELVDSRY